jgi:glycopeptide antibiotics resistance protein
MMVNIEAVLLVLLPGLIALLWYLRSRRRFTVGRLVAFAGFAVYLLGVSNYTLFPFRIDWEYIQLMRSQTRFLNGVNLIPFRDLSPKYLMSVQGWGNGVLGMPWGFAFPFVVPVVGWRAIASSGALFAAAIELTQLVISLIYGFAYRVIDVNDFLLNFTGVLSGYAALLLVAYAYQGVSDLGVRKDKVRSARFWGHFEAVLLNTAGLISSRNELQPSGQSPRRSGRVGPLRR